LAVPGTHSALRNWVPTAGVDCFYVSEGDRHTKGTWAARRSAETRVGHDLQARVDGALRSGGARASAPAASAAAASEYFRCLHRILSDCH